MAFNSNNGQNNSKEKANVNTTALQMMNKDGFDGGSTLVLAYWNSLISIKIHPALELSKQSETKRFDYEKMVSTAISLEKAHILITKIEKDILPAIEKSENKVVGIPVGADSLLVIGTGLKLTGEINPYLAIHKSLDPKTKKPELSMVYSFNKDMSIDDYDVETGTFEVGKNLNAELMIFVSVLKSSIIGLSNAIVHSSRCVDKYFKDKLSGDIGEIANKLGVETVSSGRSSYPKRQDIFSSGGKSSESANLDTLPRVENLDHIDDIDKFLN